MKLPALLLAAAAATLIGGAASAATLLVNGGFETGDLTGWTLSGNGSFSSVESYDVQAGNYAYSNGAVGSNAYLSQTFSDIAGEIYEVTGSALGDGGGSFNLDVDGASFGSGTYTGGFAQFTGSFVGTGSDTLTITNRDDPGFNYFDSFSVSGVPEPASWAIMLTGCGLAGAAVRRRRRVTA